MSDEQAPESAALIWRRYLAATQNGDTDQADALWRNFLAACWREMHAGEVDPPALPKALAA